MANLEEIMLKAWINMSVNTRENRLLNELSFNEMLVLNMIQDKECSFKELVNELNILKSQLNRVIQNLVQKKLIIAYTPENDKRSLMIKKGDNTELYKQEHARMIEIMRKIRKQIGEEDTLKLIYLLNQVASLVKEENEK
ncbi:MAG: helix-turn-helix domain-containing protein [Bacilli bacterium]|nr:helix-turn-helix domain-containing protein [Bacillales bacterium]MDY2746276.1 helix-turn-helix domain-containing protein [Bacilli bacterium]MDY6141398.1 helix-turn-helix domain-containing protein [Bacilli bacterium]